MASGGVPREEPSTMIVLRAELDDRDA